MSFPDLFELKWKFRQTGKKTAHLRQYHIEPTRFPMVLVATHRHLKDVSGTNEQIKQRQNEEMAQAQLRAVGRDGENWGI